MGMEEPLKALHRGDGVIRSMFCTDCSGLCLKNGLKTGAGWEACPQSPRGQ